MGTYRQLTAKRNEVAAPPAQLKINNAEICGDYKTITGEPRPKGDLIVGIRIPTEADDHQSRKAAEDKGGDSIREYNRQLVILHCARAICDPNDISKCHPDFTMPDQQLPLVLTSSCLDRIFDYVERLRIEQSPVFPEATDQELAELGHLICTANCLDELTSAREVRFRKLCRFLLDQIQ